MSFSLLIVIAFMCLIGIFSVLWPFLTEKAGSSSDEQTEFDGEKSDLSVRLQVLEREVASGIVAQEDADATRSEIARRFISLKRETDRQSSSSLSQSSQNRSFAIAGSFCVVLLAATIGLYSVLGTPDYFDQPFAQRVNTANEIESLVSKVEQRLKSNPEDFEGWRVLAPVYLRLNRFDEAANAYQNLAKLSHEKPKQRADFLASQADALVLASGGQISPQARGIIDGALMLDSDNRKAVLLNAFAIDQSGDVNLAFKNWSAIAQRFNQSDPTLAAMASQRLEALENVPKGPNAEQIRQAEDMSVEDRREMINSMVANLAERLADEPDNLAGWERLIQSYIVLGEAEKAMAALERAKMAMSSKAEALDRLNELRLRLFPDEQPNSVVN